jgi:hypothetical protein
MPESPSTTELAIAINSLTGISEESIGAMRSAARSFTKEHSWTNVAEEHIGLYEKVLKA